MLQANQTAVEVPDDYRGTIYRAPVGRELAGPLVRFLGHKGQPWLADFEARLAGDGLDLFAVAFSGSQPAAHAWLGSSHACTESALIGHVYTAEEHRRRGLAASLLAGLLSRFDEWGGRWVQLRTSNEAAARLYGRLGFHVILETQEGPTKRHWVMLRGGAAEGGVGQAYHESSGRWQVEACGRTHGASLCVFLSAVPGRGKLPALGLDDGGDAELKLLHAYEAQERGECRCSVLLDAANGRPHGLACLRSGRAELYAPRVGEEVRRMLAERAAASP